MARSAKANFFESRGREETGVDSDSGPISIANGAVEDSGELQRRLAVLHRLSSFVGHDEYQSQQQAAAKALKTSVRHVRRLLSVYREAGVAGLLRQERSDAGVRKVGVGWEEFILQTYREGNKGSRELSRAQVARLVASRADEQGLASYPSRRSVYRILAEEIKAKERRSKRHRIGWQGEALQVVTKEGIEIDVDYSNQVWQCDHTPADILVVAADGSYHRPTLTLVVDMHSRCIVGMHLGLDYPSAFVTCLALRHAILPKRYGSSYGLQALWESYGVPQYLYTDGGRDFTSKHLETVTTSLGIVQCLRRKPSDGGIVERALGTINREFFAPFPGYTTPRLKDHCVAAEGDACLSLAEVEKRLVRYIVDHYNQQPDARSPRESRLSRWKSNRIAMGVPPEERVLDVLLMRQDERRVYQGGYVRFANLVYRGEYLAGYAGEKVALRYDPRDITTLYVYRADGGYDVFLTRAHAMNLETERLSLVDAKAIARQLRESCREINNQSILNEIRDRMAFVKSVVEKRAAALSSESSSKSAPDVLDEAQPLVLPPSIESPPAPAQTLGSPEVLEVSEEEEEIDLDSLPEVRVYDTKQLRQMRQNYGL